MALTTETLALAFIDIETGTPLNCAYPVFAEDEVTVIYGNASLEAVRNVDYTVQLSAPDYDTFTVTPLAPLLTKINDLIAADNTEINRVVVRRELDMLTTVTPETVRLTPFLSREIERIHMRLQQHQELIQRSLVVAANVLGDPVNLFNVGSPADGTALVWDEATRTFIAGPNATEIENAETYATQALAALDNLDDRWLGAKAADPATDNDGNPLVVGAVYYNTTSNNWRYWDGSGWNDMSTPPTIGDNTILNQKLVDLTITGAKIAAQTIDNSKISNNTIQFNKLNDNAVLQLRRIPQIELTANRALALSDEGSHIYHPASDTTDRNVTIPNNVVTDFPIGAAITIYNHSANVVNININDDTLVLVGAGTTGARVLAQYGQCTLLKVEDELWTISGVGIT